MTVDEKRAEAKKLSGEGHAIIFDEVFDSNGKQVSATIHHYLSCRKCEELKSGK